MNRLLKVRRWIAILVIMSLCGCSSVKEHHLEIERSSYYPLAVISMHSKPEFTSQVYKEDLRRGAGAGFCVKGIIVSFGLLAPLCILFIPQDMMVESEYEERQKEFILKVQSLEPGLVKQADQSLLRSHAMDYLHKQDADAHEVDQDSYPPDINIDVDAHEIDQEPYLPNTEKRSQSLRKQGYPATLELSLLSLDFSEYKVQNQGKKLAFCLTLKGQGRIITNESNQEIAVRKAQYSKCMLLQQWLQNGALEKESLKLYSSLSKSILDDILFIYKKSEDDMTAPSPIMPKVIIERVAVIYEDEDTFKKEIVIEEQWDRRYEPKLLKDFAAVDDVLFTEVSTKPRFEWTIFDGPGITDVRYDFRIYSGKAYVFAMSSRSKGFLGLDGKELYPISQYITPRETVYSRDGLITSSHEIDTLLKPCSWYFWTVRASFKLYGNPRVTDWSLNRANSRSIWFKTYFPIRTPASEDDPTCWEQNVDWGPL